MNTEQTCYAATHLSILNIEGADSAKFLQGQLSCDIMALSHAQSSLAAFCTAKGRVISNMLVIKHPQGFYLILPQALSNKTQLQLQKYVLRAAVKISAADEFVVLGVNNPQDVGECYVAAHPLSADLGWLICPQAQAPDQLGDADTWRLLEMSSGIAWLDENTSELYTPQMLNLDQLGGVSFSKGCYTGQEIVSRTHFLGQAKRCLTLGVCQSISVSIGAKLLQRQDNAVLGEIIASLNQNQQTYLLLVAVNEISSLDCVLDDSARTAINIIQFTTQKSSQ